MASQSVIDAGGDCDYGHGRRGVSFEVRSVQAGNRKHLPADKKDVSGSWSEVPCSYPNSTRHAARLIYTTPSTVFRFANRLPSRHSSRKNYIRIHFKISVSRLRSTFNGDQHASCTVHVTLLSCPTNLANHRSSQIGPTRPRVLPTHCPL